MYLSINFLRQKSVDSSFIRREIDAEGNHFAAVGGVGFCIALVIDLLENFNKSISHFLVREVEKICIAVNIAVLDCEIAALVNHWQGLLDVGLVVDKLRGIVVFAHEFVDVFVAVGEQAHKICRRARGKPEVP